MFGGCCCCRCRIFGTPPSLLFGMLKHGLNVLSFLPCDIGMPHIDQQDDALGIGSIPNMMNIGIIQQKSFSRNPHSFQRSHTNATGERRCGARVLRVVVVVVATVVSHGWYVVVVLLFFWDEQWQMNANSKIHGRRMSGNATLWIKCGEKGIAKGNMFKQDVLVSQGLQDLGRFGKGLTK